MVPGRYYHVYNRGNNSENIFYEEENYSFFLRQYDKYLSVYTDVLAYCLMPNHFHFFITVKENAETDAKTNNGAQLGVVEKAFKDFFIAYSKSFSKKYGRTGSLFQARFKKKEIVNESYYSAIIQYIHLNPVKASLTRQCGEWKYSSYNAFISQKPTKVLVEEVLNWYGTLKEFIRVHEEKGLEYEKIEKFLFK